KAAKLKAQMLLQVHDELLFEVPEKEVDKTKDVARKVMESAATLSVPLVVETGVGANWAAAHYAIAATASRGQPGRGKCCVRPDRAGARRCGDAGRRQAAVGLRYRDRESALLRGHRPGRRAGGRRVGGGRGPGRPARPHPAAAPRG